MKLKHLLFAIPLAFFLLLSPFLERVINYYFDKIPPTIIFSTPSGKVRGEIEIDLEVWDKSEPLTININLGEMGLEQSFPIKVDTTTLLDGEHTIRVEVRDSSRRKNLTYSEVTFIVDNTPPGIELVWEKKVAEPGGVAWGWVKVSEPVTFLKSTLDGVDFPYLPLLSFNSFFIITGISIDNPPAENKLLIEAWDEAGNHSIKEEIICLKTRLFPWEVIRLSPDRVPLLDPELLRRENELVEGILKRLTSEVFLEGDFLLPVEGEIVSPFGTWRKINGSYIRHRGVDFKAKEGTPIYATNSGYVVLATPLKVRGNTVILNHGLGVMSLYYHLQDIKVKEGEQVKKGDIIGTVGDTGLSTAPHLHFEIRIRGIAIDPRHLF